jgi:uncharacterized protein YjiK
MPLRQLFGLGIVGLLAGGPGTLGTTQVALFLQGCRLDSATPKQARLPGRLAEVSGLGFSSNGQLLTHNDEAGRIQVIDPATGKVEREIVLGPRTPKDDYEGIEEVGGRIFMITSAGRLYEVQPASGTATASFRVGETGLGRLCEIEGLGSEPGTRTLLIACKNTRERTLSGKVVVFRWSIEQSKLATPDRITVDEKDLRGAGKNNNGFHTSGIAREPKTGHYILVAGPERSIAEVAADGRVLAVSRLRGHPQPEGIAIGSDGRLWIADERPGGGTLSAYACR